MFGSCMLGGRSRVRRLEGRAVYTLGTHLSGGALSTREFGVTGAVPGRFGPLQPDLAAVARGGNSAAAGLLVRPGTIAFTGPAARETNDG